jgi:predicted permease
VLTLQISLPRSQYQAYEPTAAFYRDLASRVEAIPGVTASGVTQALPLAGSGGCSSVFLEHRPVASGLEPPCVATLQVGPGYFRTLGIPVRGRAPDWNATYRRAGEVVVSRALAERLWPNEDPLGKGIRGNGDEPPYYRVVGVAGDVYAESVDKPALEAVYFPLLPMEGAQLWSPPARATLVVRTAADNPAALTPAIRREIAALDPGAAVGDVRTMRAVVAQSMARVSFTLILIAIAAAMALLLSAVGLYGAVAYTVGQRTNEIGIRMALGAAGMQVARLVMGQSLRLVVAGAAVGIAASLVLMRVLRALLFNVSPTDPVSLAIAVVLLLTVALVAAWIPARRATRVDPMIALRSQ